MKNRTRRSRDNARATEARELPSRYHPSTKAVASYCAVERNVLTNVRSHSSEGRIKAPRARRSPPGPGELIAATCASVYLNSRFDSGRSRSILPPPSLRKSRDTFVRTKRDTACDLLSFRPDDVTLGFVYCIYPRDNISIFFVIYDKKKRYKSNKLFFIKTYSYIVRND